MVKLAGDSWWMGILGWTLLHSVWELAGVGLVIAVVHWGTRGRSAQARYVLGLLGLGVMMAVPVGTFVYLSDQGGVRPGTVTVTAEAPAERTTEAPLIMINARSLARPVMAAPVSVQARARSVLEPWLPYAVWVYLAGLLLFSCRLVMGYGRLWQLRRRTAQTPRELQQRLAAMMREMGMTRQVGLAESALVEVPTVLGWLRPVILLPVSAVTGLSAEQLAGLLAHELAHVRRHDYLVNQVQTLVETFLFYHPAVWWLSGRVRQEREHCCDDLAARACGDKVVYAEALTRMETLRPVRGGEGGAGARLALGADGGVLLGRIRRLLGVPVPRGGGRRWNVVTAVSALVVLGALSLLVYVAGCSQNEPIQKAVAKPVEIKDEVVVTYDIGDLLSTLIRSDLAPPVNGEEYIAYVMQRIDIDPESWQDWGGKGTITAANGQLVVSQTPPNQAKIAAKLAQMRAEDKLDLLEEMKQWATELKISVFDIRDLVFFGRQSVAATKPATAPAAPAQNATQRTQLVQDLMTTIEFTIAPNSWDTVPGGLGSLRENNGYLIVRQTAPIHVRVWRLLKETRSKYEAQFGFAAMDKNEAIENVVVQVYDIQDLLAAQIKNVTDKMAPAGAMEPAKIAEIRSQLIQDLITTLTFTVDPYSWRTAGGQIGTIREENGQLIVGQSKTNQTRIAQLLQSMQKRPALVQTLLDMRRKETAEIDPTQYSLDPTEMKISLYDIRDLLILPDSVATTAATATDTGANGTNRKAQYVKDLMRTIEFTVDPKSWQEYGGSGSLQEHGGQLVVNQTLANQIQVLDLLTELRAQRGLGDLKERPGPSTTKPPAGAASAPAQLHRDYDIHDFFPPAAQPSNLATATQPARSSDQLAQDFMAAIKLRVGAGAWQGGGGLGTIEYANGTLSVNQTADIQDKVLALVTQQSIDRGGGRLSEKPALASDTPDPVVRVYDVRDLFQQVENVRAGEPSSMTAKQRSQLVADLTTTIEFTVDPYSWRDQGGAIGTIREFSGQLIINQTQANQSKILALLGQIRKKRDLQIAVSCEVLMVDAPTLQVLDTFGEIKDKAHLGVLLSEPEAKKFFDAVSRSKASSTVQAPRATLFNGQSGYLFVGQSLNYISGYTPKPAGQPSGNFGGYDPQVTTLTTGLRLDINAAISSDRRYVMAKLRPHFSRLDAMETVPGPSIGPDNHLEIQVPKLTELNPLKVATMVSIPNGSIYVMGGTKMVGDVSSLQPAGSDQRVEETKKDPTTVRYMLFLVKPTILEPEKP